MNLTNTQKLLDSFYESFPSPIKFMQKNNSQKASKKATSSQPTGGKRLQPGQLKTKSTSLNLTVEKKRKVDNGNSSVERNVGAVATARQKNLVPDDTIKCEGLSLLINQSQKSQQESLKVVNEQLPIKESTTNSALAKVRLSHREYVETVPELFDQTILDRRNDPPRLPPYTPPPHSCHANHQNSQHGMQAGESFEMHRNLIHASHTVQKILGYFEGSAATMLHTRKKIIHEINKQQMLMQKFRKFIQQVQDLQEDNNISETEKKPNHRIIEKQDAFSNSVLQNSPSWMLKKEQQREISD